MHMRFVVISLAALLTLIALLLPFVGVGFSDGALSTSQKLLGSGVLIVIALLLVLVTRKRAS
jgi:hypothetical protein